MRRFLARFESPASELLLIAIVALVAASLATCGGGGNGTPTGPTPAPPSAVTVTVLDDRFEPKSVVVEAGQTVRWDFAGTHPNHSVTAVAGAFDSGLRQNGSQFERTFTAADAGRTFEYRCQTHAVCCQMQGSVRVGQDAPPPNPGY